MSWPCNLPEEHLGPHQAIEVPSSKARRDRWLAEQPATPAPEPAGAVPTPAPVLPDSPVERVRSEALLAGKTDLPILPVPFAPETQRLEGLKSLLNRDDAELPTAVRDWMMAMVAYTSLVTLHEMAHREFAKGALGVVLTPELLDNLLPQSLRTHLGRT